MLATVPATAGLPYSLPPHFVPDAVESVASDLPSLLSAVNALESIASHRPAAVAPYLLPPHFVPDAVESAASRRFPHAQMSAPARRGPSARPPISYKCPLHPLFTFAACVDYRHHIANKELHPNGRFPCWDCSRDYSSINGLINHQFEQHRQGHNYFCGYCNYTSPKGGNVSAHVATHRLDYVSRYPHNRTPPAGEIQITQIGDEYTRCYTLADESQLDRATLFSNRIFKRGCTKI